MTQPKAMQFIVMADEHVANAISQQLKQKGVNVVRLIDHLAEGTPDPDVLDYCHQHGYALITLDERIRGHVNARLSEGLEHAGIFLGTSQLQGSKGIGPIVNFIVFYHESIVEGAATVENDVYNMIIPIS